MATPKERIERRKLRWKVFIQSVRLWLWCVAGISVMLLLPGLKEGVIGISLYLPTPLEAGVSLGLSFLTVMLDEKLNGGKLAKTPEAYKRMRNHAIIIGMAAFGAVGRFVGG